MSDRWRSAALRVVVTGPGDAEVFRDKVLMRQVAKFNADSSRQRNKGKKSAKGQR
jgi:hypothetical protein